MYFSNIENNYLNICFLLELFDRVKSNMDSDNDKLGDSFKSENFMLEVRHLCNLLIQKLKMKVVVPIYV